MECAAAVVLAPWPASHSWKSRGLSGWFITTTATLPLGLRKAVVFRVSRFEEATMGLAPGRMNFEKWPM